MRAIVGHEYGPPEEVLALEEIDPPTAGDHDVIVRVQASSVNPADWHLVRGEPRVARLQLGLRRPKYPVLGCDVAGVVHAAGSGVTGLAPGDAVFGSPFMRGFGGFADHVRVPEECLAPTPAGVTTEDAATLPLAGLTALQGLRDHGRVEAGQRVLIIGAAGGVGTFAVQLAKVSGAEVTAVCSTRNVDLVRKLGADHVVDRTQEDVTRSDRRYDVILQVSGDAAPSALRRILTPEGVLVMISGDAEGRWLGAVGRLVAARLSAPFVGPSLVSFTVKPNADDLRHLAGLVGAGTLTPVVDRTYPLAEVPQALRYLESGQARGKVVVTHQA